MIEKKTKEEAIAALKAYVRLPDPPKPGTEKAQLEKLRNANLIVAGYLISVPFNEVENEIEGMLQSYADKTTKPDGVTIDRQAVLRYDIARCIANRAADIARKGA